MKMRKSVLIRRQRNNARNVINRNVFKISVWTRSFHGKYWMKSIRKRYYLAKSRN